MVAEAKVYKTQVGIEWSCGEIKDMAVVGWMVEIA